MKEDLSMESLTKHWNHWPLSPIPLDKQIVAIWKSFDGTWKSNKFEGYLFYRKSDHEPFNDIPVRWIYFNRKDEVDCNQG